MLPFAWRGPCILRSTVYEPQNTRKMLLAVFQTLPSRDWYDIPIKTSRNSRNERFVLLWRWHPQRCCTDIFVISNLGGLESLWHDIDKWTSLAYTTIFESLCLCMLFWRVAIISQTGRGHALTKLDHLLSPGRDRATNIKLQRVQLQTWLCFAGFGHVKTPLETTNFGSSGLLQLTSDSLCPQALANPTALRLRFVWKLWNKLGPGLIHSLPLNSTFWKASWSFPGSKAQILAIALTMEQVFAEIIEIIVLQILSAACFHICNRALTIPHPLLQLVRLLFLKDPLHLQACTPDK